MKYTPTIGLEVHAELKTKTKMFCNSKNDPDEKQPNINICPVCMAHPGTLPVINKEAVRHVLRVGVALGGTLSDFTEFDRKNYFYPDLPKGYQISQYKYPLVSGGELNGVSITRVHLEEDTGRSSHETGGESLVDFNRAGVPLMELVTEPVIKTAKEAGNFARELQLLLRYLGASEANMEKGEMRVEANVSVSETFASADQCRTDADSRGNILRNSALSPRHSATLGTKVEVKNINSFKAVEKAIEYEIKRQSELLARGEKVVQETRGWDENKGKTFSQRLKEESHDYRYFPEPDLPKLHLRELPEFHEDVLRKELPELPREKRERYKKEFGIKDKDIELYISDMRLDRLFTETIHFFKDDSNIAKHSNIVAEFIQLASNYIVSDLVGLAKSTGQNFNKIQPEYLSLLIKMIAGGEISSRGAKDILAIMLSEGGSPDEIAKKEGLAQISGKEELKEIVEKIIVGNPGVVADFKSGKEQALQFLIGQGMKETKGAANPKTLEKLFKEHIT